MEEKELRDLIVRGESLKTEFKRDAGDDNDFVEAAVCLANTEGGYVLLGVEDDGEITGLTPRRLELGEDAITAQISNRTVPSLRTKVVITALGDHYVAVIHVQKSRVIIQTSKGLAYHRFLVHKKNPECKPMRPHDMASRLGHFGDFDYSSQPVSQATWQDLDPLEFVRLRKTIDRNPTSDRALLELGNEDLSKALGITVTQEGRLVPTVAGMLLVGDQNSMRRYVPGHEVSFQEFGPNLEARFNEFYRGPLIRLFQRFEELLEARNNEQEFDFAMQRIGIPRYPRAAFREALANALTHRDYTINNAVYVQLDARQKGLSITSPGGFVEGVHLDNLLTTSPKPRNRPLADVFKRLGLVERMGRGIARIFAEVLGYGRPAPSYEGSTRDSVKVFIPSGEADIAFVRLIMETRERYQYPVDWRHLLILRRVADEGELTTREASNLIQNDEVVTRSLLEAMVELGLLEPRGTKRSRVYHLSSGVYQSFGKPSAYVRRKGFSDLQREQMIVNYLEDYQTISRAEVAKLCQLSDSQAEYLLRKLRKADKIELIGRGRGAHYQLKDE
ncbi:MAG: putative DNA binding domain-containing protein [Trueperaceae bacterium]|nr:putative DNA binding domain-containing protein [Trueperaceae bacterium]